METMNRPLSSPDSPLSEARRENENLGETRGPTDRQVTSVFTVQPLFHHRHSTKKKKTTNKQTNFRL